MRLGQRLGISGFCVSMVLALVACLPQQQEALPLRPGIKPFDAAKATELAPARRAALEQELFSELQMWNRGDRRYPDQAGIARREQRWQAMADEGLELAHITLTVLEPRTGKAHELTPAINRLEQLAEQGDSGAMCLIERLTNVSAAQLDSKQYDATARKWLERGAEQGHPECLITMGGKLLGGVGYAQDTRRGLEMSFRGHQLGYAHGAGALILYYAGRGLEDADNLRRAYCWLSLEDRFDFIEPVSYLRYKIQKQSMKFSAESQEELDKLGQWSPNLEDCLALGNGG